MGIKKHGLQHCLEFQGGDKSHGILCSERILVQVHNDGAGHFLSIKTENLEPDDEFDSYMVTVDKNDIPELCKILTEILAEHDD